MRDATIRVSYSPADPLVGEETARLDTVTLACGCVLERPIGDSDDESDASFYASLWAAMDALNRVDRWWNCGTHHEQKIVAATFR